MREKKLNTLSLLFLCLLSRFFFIGLILLFDYLLPDHEAQGVTLLHVREIETGETEIPLSLSSILLSKSFIRWDSVYFIRIGREGYQEDKDFAFFPLYPLLLSMISQFCFQSVSIDRMVWSGLCLNSICFISSVFVLKNLLETIPRIKMHQVKYTLFIFIFSPITIFFTTIYSESLYCLLALSGMYFLLINSIFLSGICFFFASWTRSNGLFNVVFVMAHPLSQCYLLWQKNQPEKLCCILKSLFSAISLSFFIILPYFLFNLFAFHSLCPMSGESSLSCSISPSPDHLCRSWLTVYPSLQTHYWNVGFLRQYSFRQIPNFLLAAPILSLSMFTVASIFQPIFLSISTQRDPNFTLVPFESLIPFALHLLSLSIVSLFFSHPQISTRLLLSASPILYLSLSSILFPSQPDQSTNVIPERLFVPLSLFSRQIALLIFGFYLFGGIALHCNYFPWT